MSDGFIYQGGGQMEFYIKQSEVELSQRKLEGYLKLAEIVQWGRKNPTKFSERFLGIEFL